MQIPPLMDVDGEVQLLVRKITELGKKDTTNGNMRVKYGVLFRETSDDFEALAGTMRAAKRKVKPTPDQTSMVESFMHARALSCADGRTNGV